MEMSLQAAHSVVCFQGDSKTTTLGKASSDLFPCILHYVIILHILVSQSFMDIPVYLCLYHSHGSTDKENAIILLSPIPSPQGHLPDHLSGTTQ